MIDAELEVRLLDARQQLDNLLRELRAGAKASQVRLGLLRAISELHGYLLEAAAPVAGR